MLPPSNSLKVLEMVENVLETLSPKVFSNIVFATILSELKVNVLGGNNQKIRKLLEISHQYILLAIMIY